MELATCRQTGFGGAGPIPWTAINDYVKAQDMRPFEAKLVHASVRAMDRRFIEHGEHKRKANAATKPKKFRRGTVGARRG